MIKYSEFRPTSFDYKGLGLPEQQDWLVLGLSRNRDSGELDQSNFDAALKSLGGESDTVEVHRFGHWGPGWFEIILIKPGSTQVEIGESIEASLSDYPILDEEDFSSREWESYTEGWDNYARRDFIKGLKAEFGLSDAAYDALDDCDSEQLREFFQTCNPSGDYYYSESSGVCVNTRSSIAKCTRDALAGFLRTIRQTALA